MKNIIAFCFALISFSYLSAQTTQTDKSTSSNEVFAIVQQKPVFPGDIAKWLADNIKYPEDARNNNIQGTVYVQFIVEKDGSVSGVNILREVKGGNSLNNEAVRVVSTMPKWTPGMENGLPVRVSYMLPIRFTLNDNNTTAPAQSK